MLVLKFIGFGERAVLETNRSWGNRPVLGEPHFLSFTPRSEARELAERELLALLNGFTRFSNSTPTRTG